MRPAARYPLANSWQASRFINIETWETANLFYCCHPERAQRVEGPAVAFLGARSTKEAWGLTARRYPNPVPRSREHEPGGWLNVKLRLSDDARLAERGRPRRWGRWLWCGTFLGLSLRFCPSRQDLNASVRDLTSIIKKRNFVHSRLKCAPVLIAPPIRKPP
jgi:hypothetical protein